MYFQQLFSKYISALDILIHQFVHMEFSDGTLLILLNFRQTIFFNETDLNSFKFSVIIFQSLEVLAWCYQKILSAQIDESKCLAYRHILKTGVKVL